MRFSPGALLSTANDLASKFYTIQQRVEVVEKEASDLRSELKIVISEIADLKSRVSRLEEARLTLKAEAQAEITKTVSDLEVAYAQIAADLKLQNALAAIAATQTTAPLPAPPAKSKEY